MFFRKKNKIQKMIAEKKKARDDHNRDIINFSGRLIKATGLLPEEIENLSRDIGSFQIRSFVFSTRSVRGATRDFGWSKDVLIVQPLDVNGCVLDWSDDSSILPSKEQQDEIILMIQDFLKE